VAVIGASRTPGTIGYETLHNLLLGGFTGAVYPVNPHADSIHSVRAYPSVSDLPEAPELAIVVVPKEFVAPIVEECGEAGVRGLVVITAGFKEVGGAGVERERELLALVRRYGMRMVGPNCMGLLNLAPAISLNGTFAPSTPPRGTIAFMSQSGAMGVTILDYAAEFGIGVSSFVSMGNKADVSSNDLLEYWREDPDVGVILMYLENFGNPRHFPLIARETTRKKPVIAVKAGRSRAGARAATSHTGALAAVDVATDALFAQCGVIRMDTVAGLFDAAMAFSSGPLPAGPHVAIVTNAGGPGIIIADACEATGLAVTPLSEESQARLRIGLPEEASVVNPVDMIASARADDYRTALEIVLGDPKVDAVIAAFVPPLGIDQVQITRAIRDVAAERTKPVMAVLMGREGLPQGMAELREARIPAYIFPESAARALAATYRYRRWLDRPAGELVSFEVDTEKAGELLSAARLAGHEMVPLDIALEVLDSYGIPVAAYRVVKTLDEAVMAAGELGYPVVLKAILPALVHKTEQGGVAVDLETKEELDAAFERMQSDVGDPDGLPPRYLVQEMLPGGKEVIVGMSLEPNFGPLLMFGLGGIYVEAIGDIVFRAHPVSDVDASDMVRSVRGFRLLEGVRGEPGVDLHTLSEVIQRTSQLVGSHEEIVELDINPFLAFSDPDRCVAVDARIRLTRP
jgi:acetyl coenzyme A synthetase (ADP forming)-like protein